MAKKFYVVWAGRETGIFTDWASCKRSVDKFAGARYKSFTSRAEAESAFGSAGAQAGGRPAQKKSSANKAASKSVTSLPKMGNSDVEIFCDGGCDPNPGRAGSGTAVYRDGTLVELWYGLYNSHGTNNTAELNALYQSLLIAHSAIKDDRSVTIYCDSMYSINCISLWAYGWKKKGWKKSSGEIKNLELIKQIHTLYDEIKGSLQLLHIKAHAGIEGNELADRMTMVAVDRKEPEYSLYDGELNIAALLALRAG